MLHDDNNKGLEICRNFYGSNLIQLCQQKTVQFVVNYLN